MKMTKITNKDLLEMFDALNRKYFRGEQEIESIRFKRLRVLGRTENVFYTRPTTPAERKKEGLGKKSLACYYRYRIWISEDLRDSRRLTATTLIHEMAHISIWSQKSTKGDCNSSRFNKFNKEMLRLAKAGAFNGWW
jgi:hypothetical protein